MVITMDFNRCITEGRKPEQRAGHISFMYNGRLFVWGGTRYEKDSVFSYFNNLFALDIETLKWKEIKTYGADLSPRYGHSAILVSSQKMHSM